MIHEESRTTSGPSAERPPRPSRQRDGEAKQRSPAVLIVDDEADIRESLAEYIGLMLPDVRVLSAEDAAEALSIVEDTPVDAVVSDYRMPGMDGIRLLSELHARQPGLTCILITAFPDPDLKVRAREEAAVEAFMPKPVDVEELVERLNGLVGPE